MKIAVFFASILIFSSLAFIIYYFIVTSGTKLQAEKLTLTESKIHLFDGNGAEIKLPQKYIKLSQMPSYLPASFVSVEDKRFFQHNGIDYKRICKAIIKNISTFSFREGASTISQQLIKNTHLSGEKTISRKLKEWKLTKTLEKRYSKEQILELYLNSIYFGHSAFGIGNASRYYFGKEVENLSPAECATLSALVKSPNRYSPFRNAEKCLARRNLVLSLMHEQGFLSEEQAHSAKHETLPATPSKMQKSNCYFTLVEEEISQLFPDLSSGDTLYVYTAYEDKLQQKLEQTDVSSDACLLVRSNEKNALKAFYSTCGTIRRLPASAIKPLAVYAPALQENLISPATPILDEKTSFSGYSPSNYGGIYGGYMSARYALSHSVNIPAVKILNELGVEKAEHYLNKMQLPLEQEDKSLALALGGMRKGYTLLQLADGYATFANEGYFTPSHAIQRVTDERGKTLFENKYKQKVFDDDVCALINSILKTTVEEGTAKKLKTLHLPLCAKTGTGGTKEGNTDAYTIAYTKNDVVAVWLGNRDNTPIQATGGGLPANLAYEVLKELYQSTAPQNFSFDGVLEVTLDKEEYDVNHKLLRADPLAPSYLTQKELFRESAIPQEQSTQFSQPKIKKPLISVKNGAVYIELCQTYYYDYVVKRQSGTQNLVVYRGKYRQNVIDNSIRQGETYTYSVIPIWQGIEGEEVILPSIYVQQEENSLPGEWWNVTD